MGRVGGKEGDCIETQNAFGIMESSVASINGGSL